MDYTRLVFFRNELAITKRELSSMLVISESIYSRWENNKIDIPTKWIYKIANFYNINIDYILNLTDKKIIILSDDKIDKLLVGKRIKMIREDFTNP